MMTASDTSVATTDREHQPCTDLGHLLTLSRTAEVDKPPKHDRRIVAGLKV
jgi:hypothetical protein